MIPQNFAYELPRRCVELLDALETHVPGTDNEQLSMTFLLSMAMPLLVFPDEVLNNEDLVFANVNKLRDGVEATLSQPFAETPFRADAEASRASWYMSKLGTKPKHPREIRAGTPELISYDAAREADDLVAKTLLRRLRNALSHAGVVYLDEHGCYEPAERARMLAFVSRHGNANYSVVAVSEDEFGRFLRRWARWLTDSGFGKLSAAA